MWRTLNNVPASNVGDSDDGNGGGDDLATYDGEINRRVRSGDKSGITRAALAATSKKSVTIMGGGGGAIVAFVANYFARAKATVNDMYSARNVAYGTKR